jgi:hypothetical protein
MRVSAPSESRCGKAKKGRPRGESLGPGSRWLRSAQRCSFRGICNQAHIEGCAAWRHHASGETQARSKGFVAPLGRGNIGTTATRVNARDEVLMRFRDFDAIVCNTLQCGYLGRMQIHDGGVRNRRGAARRGMTNFRNIRFAAANPRGTGPCHQGTWRGSSKGLPVREECRAAPVFCRFTSPRPLPPCDPSHCSLD